MWATAALGDGATLLGTIGAIAGTPQSILPLSMPFPDDMTSSLEATRRSDAEGNLGMIWPVCCSVAAKWRFRETGRAVAQFRTDTVQQRSNIGEYRKRLALWPRGRFPA